MNVAVQGFLAGLGLALVLIIFEYVAITREVAERSKKVAKKLDWDSNQRSRMIGMIRFGLVLPVAFAAGAWWGLR
jgi:hypothetical protein